MAYRRIKKTTLQPDNSDSPIVDAGKELLKSHDFTDDDIEYYSDRIIGVLDDYAKHFGENKEVDYLVRKRRACHTYSRDVTCFAGYCRKLGNSIRSIFYAYRQRRSFYRVQNPDYKLCNCRAFRLRCT